MYNWEELGTVTRGQEEILRVLCTRLEVTKPPLNAVSVRPTEQHPTILLKEDKEKPCLPTKAAP